MKVQVGDVLELVGPQNEQGTQEINDVWIVDSIDRRKMYLRAVSIKQPDYWAYHPEGAPFILPEHGGGGWKWEKLGEVDK